MVVRKGPTTSTTRRAIQAARARVEAPAAWWQTVCTLGLLGAGTLTLAVVPHRSWPASGLRVIDASRSGRPNPPGKKSEPMILSRVDQTVDVQSRTSPTTQPTAKKKPP